MRCMTWRAVSDRPAPPALVHALGAQVVKQKADEGDRAAQYGQGWRLINEERVAGAGGAGRSSAKVEVGMALCIFRSLTTSIPSDSLVA